MTVLQERVSLIHRMGCRKLSYYQEGGTGKIVPLFLGEGYVKKTQPEKKRDDYYPFGLTFNSFTRSYSEPQKYKFNGFEHQDELGVYSSYYRILDPALGRWWQIDPKASERESPYVSMANNPIIYNDLLGDTTMYYNMDGEVLGTINNEGAVSRVKINSNLYTAAVATAQLNDIDLANQGNANNFVTTLNNGATGLESAAAKHGLDINVIAFETGEVSMAFTGEANASNNSQSDGDVNMLSHFDDGSTVNIGTWSALSGPWGNGSLENGDYTSNNLRDNRTGSYSNNGVGFTYDLNPTFSTGRTLLRFHPDGGTAGTQGCIGLTGDSTSLATFRLRMNAALRNRESVNVNVDINNNPNNDGRN